MRTLAAFAAALLLAVPAFAADAAKPKAKAGKAGDPAKGKVHYETYCFTCHGMSGKGDGPSAAGLTVKPRNHTDDALMSKLSDDRIFKTIKEGGKAVGKSELMPA